MVLAELGGKLRASLQKLQSTNDSDALTTESLNALLSEISRALIESDVNVQLVMTLRTNIQKKVGELVASNSDAAQSANANINRMVQRTVLDELTNMLTPNGSGSGDNSKKVNKPYNMKRGKPNVIMFVGLQGAGKTTSIAKYAHYYQRRGWKTAMVCADTFRAGAFDQLKQNATKLRIPFYGSYTEADPVLIAEEGVERFTQDGYEVIIVDTSGRHRQEEALFDEMQEISAAVQPDNTIFVMDATQGQAVYDQALAFHGAVNVGSVIVTKLDGHAKGGGALSAVAATGSPIVFLGSGERFEDLDPFNAKSFVNKLLGFGDVHGLMEEMKSIAGGQNQEELMANMSKGVFTLRDMYKQFQQVMKMGPMDKVMGMIPGMPDYLIPKGGDDDSTNRLRKFMYMMDSMSNAELDGKVDLQKKHDPAVEKRIRRIAAGSGTHPTEVKMLLQAHAQFSGMVSKMGKSGMMGKGGQAKQKQMMEQMRKNPQAMMKQLQNNPQAMQMMQQMGGMPGMGGGGGGGGMPDMSTMMQMMGSMGGGGGGMPGMGGMGGGRGGGGGGGMPDMNTMMQMMGSMGGGGGGMPGMGGMGGGRGGGQPDMNQMMQMMNSMGGGGGGMPGTGGGGGGGGMPDMAQMMQQMGMGGGGRR